MAVAGGPTGGTTSREDTPSGGRFDGAGEAGYASDGSGSPSDSSPTAVEAIDDMKL